MRPLAARPRRRRSRRPSSPTSGAHRSERRGRARARRPVSYPCGRHNAHGNSAQRPSRRITSVHVLVHVHVRVTVHVPREPRPRYRPHTCTRTCTCTCTSTSTCTCRCTNRLRGLPALCSLCLVPGRRTLVAIKQRWKLYIDGKWTDGSGGTFDVLNPATEEVVAQAPNGTAADLERAVRAARRAFDEGPWPRTSPAERANALTR